MITIYISENAKVEKHESGMKGRKYAEIFYEVEFETARRGSADTLSFFLVELPDQDAGGKISYRLGIFATSRENAIAVALARAYNDLEDWAWNDDLKVTEVPDLFSVMVQAKDFSEKEVISTILRELKMEADLIRKIEMKNPDPELEELIGLLNQLNDKDREDVLRLLQTKVDRLNK